MSIVITLDTSAKTSFNPDHMRGNNARFESYAVVNLDKPMTPDKEIDRLIDLKIYSTSSRAYACIWVRDEHKVCAQKGSGYAGGYGYHRPSAAVQNAIQNAGFRLSYDIAGSGDSAIFEAVLAVARAMGYTNCGVVRAFP